MTPRKQKEEEIIFLPFWPIEPIVFTAQKGSFVFIDVLIKKNVRFFLIFS
jgi:hypothetical protein